MQPRPRGRPWVRRRRPLTGLLEKHIKSMKCYEMVGHHPGTSDFEWPWLEVKVTQNQVPFQEMADPAWHPKKNVAYSIVKIFLNVIMA